MDARALTNIIDTFQDFRDTYIKQATPFPTVRPTNVAAKTFMQNQVMLYIAGPALEKYQKLVAKFDRPPWNSTLSEGYREGQIQKAITTAWNEPGRAQEAFEEVVKNLNRDSPYGERIRSEVDGSRRLRSSSAA